MRSKLGMVLPFLSLAMIILCNFSSPASAGSIIVRPIVAYGAEKNSDSPATLAGVRVMLAVNKSKSYGIEISRLLLPTKGEEREVTTFGIILEQKLWGWFSMGIGTIGYFGAEPNSGNPVGITSHLGWEPTSDNMLVPFAAFRTDYIWGHETTNISSLMVGLSFRI